MARIISALFLIPVALVVVIYATPAFYLIGIGMVGTVCLHEYFSLTRSMGIRAQPWIGYFGFWILLAAFRQSRFPAITLIAIMLLPAFLSAMWRRRPVRECVSALMAELTGIFYFALLLWPALPLRYQFGEKLGLQWTVVLLTVVWVGDSAALVVGKKLGKSLLAPIISPNKTKEGAAAGLLAGVIAASALQRFLFTDLPLRHVFLASILVGIFGQLGDLAESLLKRAAEVKDSSHIIPGHGGVFDRVDSLLFALPILYFYLLWLYPPS